MKASFICFLAVLFNREVNYFFQLLIFPSGDWFSSKVVRKSPPNNNLLNSLFFLFFVNFETGQDSLMRQENVTGNQVIKNIKISSQSSGFC